MKITNKEYDELAKKHSPNSKTIINMIKAFVIGGLICVIGQALIYFYMSFDLSKQDSGTMTSITLIFLSALLTGLEVYDRVARHGGAGTLVPITGFANAVVSPALEFKSEGHIAGLAAKMFVVAGPVIVYGLAAAFVYGILVYIFTYL
ncbi:MAG: stage V sporulation protein AC [Clostridiales bacterium]|nr:stage V sporulation protein AC [Clostridiales bacterium]